MKRAHILTEREIKRVFAHIAQRPFAERNRAMFQLSIYAGMVPLRRGPPCFDFLIEDAV